METQPLLCAPRVLETQLNIATMRKCTCNDTCHVRRRLRKTSHLCIKAPSVIRIMFVEGNVKHSIFDRTHSWSPHQSVKEVGIHRIHVQKTLSFYAPCSSKMTLDIAVVLNALAACRSKVVGEDVKYLGKTCSPFNIGGTPRSLICNKPQRTQRFLRPKPSWTEIFFRHKLRRPRYGLASRILQRPCDV